MIDFTQSFAPLYNSISLPLQTPPPPTNRFKSQTASVGALKQRADEYPMFDLRSDEDMITHPQETLKRLFDFLELPYTDEFISTCASIVYSKPHKSRSVHFLFSPLNTVSLLLD